MTFGHRTPLERVILNAYEAGAFGFDLRETIKQLTEEYERATAPREEDENG